MKRSKFQREALALLREQNATLRRIAAVMEQTSKIEPISKLEVQVGLTDQQRASINRQYDEFPEARAL